MNALSQVLVDPREAAALIEGGAYLTIAGAEAVLAGLPKGNWIGGTIPYFMTQEGGRPAAIRCSSRHSIPMV